MAVGTKVLINIELRFIDISIIFIFSSNTIRRMEMKKKIQNLRYYFSHEKCRK